MGPSQVYYYDKSINASLTLPKMAYARICFDNIRKLFSIFPCLADSRIFFHKTRLISLATLRIVKPMIFFGQNKKNIQCPGINHKKILPGTCL